MWRRIKYLIQIAHYIILIFQRSKREEVNEALGFGLRQSRVQNLPAENGNISSCVIKNEAVIFYTNMYTAGTDSKCHTYIIYTPVFTVYS